MSPIPGNAFPLQFYDLPDIRPGICPNKPKWTQQVPAVMTDTD